MNSLFTNPDCLAFLATIRAQPDDDAPRLIFADWLDDQAATVRCDCDNGWVVSRTRVAEMGADEYNESRGRCTKCGGKGERSNGAAEWAEYIRISVKYGSFSQLANAPGVPLEDRLTWCVAFDIKHEWAIHFPRQNRPSWDRETFAQCGELDWNRGLVERADLTVEQWLAVADRLSLHPLQSVSITRFPEVLTATLTLIDSSERCSFKGCRTFPFVLWQEKTDAVFEQENGPILHSDASYIALMQLTWPHVPFDFTEAIRASQQPREMADLLGYATLSNLISGIGF